MKLYHGSPHFGLEILHSNNSRSVNFEGQAIYLTDSRKTAERYACDLRRAGPASGSIYEVHLDHEYLDLSSVKAINLFLQQQLQKVSLAWDEYLEYDSLHGVLLNEKGANSVSQLGENLAHILQHEHHLDVELVNSVKQKINEAVNAYNVIKLVHYESYMFVVKNLSLPVVQETFYEGPEW